MGIWPPTLRMPRTTLGYSSHPWSTRHPERRRPDAHVEQRAKLPPKSKEPVASPPVITHEINNLTETMTPTFLHPDTLIANCALAAFDSELTARVLTMGDRILASEPMTQAILRAHRGIYFDWGKVAPGTWEALDAAFGDEVNVAHVILGVDSVRMTAQRHAERGIDPKHTLPMHERHAQGINRHHNQVHGCDGYERHTILEGWMPIVGSGDLLRAGRLEYHLQTAYFPLMAYTHNGTGELAVLAAHETEFDADGFQVGPRVWKSTFEQTATHVTGERMDRRGFATRERITLALDEWTLSLRPGDWVLGVHIPEGPGMTLEAIKDSMREALHVFATHFPDRPTPAGFVCDSWLFSTQLAEFLGPAANSVRWQREGFLVPVDSGGEWMLRFVFGNTVIDPVSAPRDTRLRRAILDHLAAGNTLRCGGYFLLARDLGRFGAQPYG
jgi:hypothetical protein